MTTEAPIRHVYRLARELRDEGLEGWAERLEQQESLVMRQDIIVRLRELGRNDLARRVRNGEFDGES